MSFNHFYFYRSQQIIDNSCLHFNDISAKDWGNYSFNGESCQSHINVINGMSKIVETFYPSLRNHILFNCKVEQIIWKNGNENAIKILCNDGSVYTTANLICTIPLGVLKERHMQMFSPALPNHFQEVIKNIGFGTINKIFLHFEEKWWPDGWKGLQLIWNDELQDVSSDSS